MTEKELKDENEKLKQLLKETLSAMCSYRAEKGYCTKCKFDFLCKPRTLIPKIEKILKIKK